jgi:hypothetical protein
MSEGTLPVWVDAALQGLQKGDPNYATVEKAVLALARRFTTDGVNPNKEFIETMRAVQKVNELGAVIAGVIVLLDHPKGTQGMSKEDAMAHLDTHVTRLAAERTWAKVDRVMALLMKWSKTAGEVSLSQSELKEVLDEIPELAHLLERAFPRTAGGESSVQTHRAIDSDGNGTVSFQEIRTAAETAATRGRTGGEEVSAASQARVGIASIGQAAESGAEAGQAAGGRSDEILLAEFATTLTRHSFLTAWYPDYAKRTDQLEKQLENYFLRIADLVDTKSNAIFRGYLAYAKLKASLITKTGREPNYKEQQDAFELIRELRRMTIDRSVAGSDSLPSAIREIQAASVPILRSETVNDRLKTLIRGLLEELNERVAARAAVPAASLTSPESEGTGLEYLRSQRVRNPKLVKAAEVMLAIQQQVQLTPAQSAIGYEKAREITQTNEGTYQQILKALRQTGARLLPPPSVLKF